MWSELALWLSQASFKRVLARWGSLSALKLVIVTLATVGVALNVSITRKPHLKRNQTSTSQFVVFG